MERPLLLGWLCAAGRVEVALGRSSLRRSWFNSRSFGSRCPRVGILLLPSDQALIEADDRERALKLAPDSVDLRRHLIAAHQLTGNCARAQEYMA
jgi:hypothetical protein